MKLPPLTGVYPMSVKPAHVGPYKVDTFNGNTRCYSFWDGKCWGLVGDSHIEASYYCGHPSHFMKPNSAGPSNIDYPIGWRGLTKEVK